MTREELLEAAYEFLAEADKAKKVWDAKKKWLAQDVRRAVHDVIIDRIPGAVVGGYGPASKSKGKK